MSNKELKDLKNVGKAFLKDLEILGITSVKELVDQDPTKLFHELEMKTGSHQDFCVWDVFAAIIDEAKTGHGRPWWNYTKQRKELQASGVLNHVDSLGSV